MFSQFGEGVCVPVMCPASFTELKIQSMVLAGQLPERRAARRSVWRPGVNALAGTLGGPEDLVRK
ncbi:hypothetical protein ACFWNE_31550 [Streptomyces goshikiensis]|uniref:hypothetical protein n=1 Tax=Streptomyces goshikiensis TaxID=1942 RepID=UPI003667563D